MLKRILKKMKGLCGDDGGAAIVVVLAAMTFVIVLVSILLHLSLVNIQMKRLDREGKLNFYSAETAMSEIRAGIQAAVSEAIKEAYSGVLVSYNTLTKEEQTAAFTSSFYTHLYNGSALFTEISLGAYAYDTGTLRSYVLAPEGAEVEIGGSGVVQPAEDGIVLKGITVKYTAGGYETTVSADIKIATPVLPYMTTRVTQTAAPDYALIAKGALRQPAGAGTVGIAGNARVGGVSVAGAGNTLNVTNAQFFVSAGPVAVTGGSIFFNMNSSLWAEDIILDGAGEIHLSGDAYIRNDLNLLGSGTRAVLSGRYYGYGASMTQPDFSSAILINGRDTVLDMSGLRALLLAGRSFVDYASGPGGFVMTGESVSVKSNQLAYLVPESCLTGGVTNPLVYTADPGNEVFQSYVLLDQIVMNNKTLADYGITSTTDNIQYIRKTVGGTNLLYFCLKFTGETDAEAARRANAYFKDYYNLNGDFILKYLDIYSNGISLFSSTTKNIAAAAFSFDGYSLGPLYDATNVPPNSVAEINASYNNLCVTLSRTETGGGETSAYDYFVDGAQIAALSGPAVYAEDGTPKAVVVNGSYTIDAATPDSVHIVIASGDVAVRRNFTGLILTGGDATIYGSVTADRAAVADALGALLYYNTDLQQNAYYFLNPLRISPFNSAAHNDGGDVWNMNALVTYENWKKNAS